MPKPGSIDLGGVAVSILYEDRSVLALDKPPGWLVAPESWEHTRRNLHRALLASIQAGDFWARVRHLKYLRFVHRLDAETSGVLLCARSPGAMPAYSRLFENREVEKVYWAVVHGLPRRRQWTCRLRLAADPHRWGRMVPVVAADQPGRRQGKRAPRSKSDRPRPDAKEAQTHFRVLATGPATALVEARPLTGRMHQIRIHLAAAGHPIVGDDLYGGGPPANRTTRDGPVSSAPVLACQDFPQSPARPVLYTLALRAVRLAYRDPFTRRRVEIEAPTDDFLRHFGFGGT